MGSENPDSIRGVYLDGVVIDEIADCDPRVWSEVVRPALSDRMGWCIFIGTPKGMNHFYYLYEYAKESRRNYIEAKARGEDKPDNWLAMLFRADETGIVPEDELEDLKSEMSEEEFSQEFLCSFNAALRGAYWGKAIEEIENKGHIRKVPHDKALPVDTYWDLGISDTTTVWFVQQTPTEIRVIDFIEMSGVGLDYYAKMLQEGHRKEYSYGEHNWPHDGGSRDLSSGKERSTLMRDFGVTVRVRPKYDVADSINAARLLLSKCFFDESSTAKGLSALKSYQRKWDAKSQIFQDKPLHDWASHAADAFRLMAMCIRPYRNRLARQDAPRYARNQWSIFGKKKKRGF